MDRGAAGRVHAGGRGARRVNCGWVGRRGGQCSTQRSSTRAAIDVVLIASFRRSSAARDEIDEIHLSQRRRWIVTELAIAPVKSTRLTSAQELDIGPTGAAGDRQFLVVDADNALLLSSRTPKLLEIAARWDGETLALRFPDGAEVAAVPEPVAPAVTANYEGRPIAGRLVEGELAAGAVRAPEAARPVARSAMPASAVPTTRRSR